MEFPTLATVTLAPPFGQPRHHVEVEQRQRRTGYAKKPERVRAVDRQRELQGPDVPYALRQRLVSIEACRRGKGLRANEGSGRSPCGPATLKSGFTSTDDCEKRGADQLDHGGHPVPADTLNPVPADTLPTVDPVPADTLTPFSQTHSTPGRHLEFLVPVGVFGLGEGPLNLF